MACSELDGRAACTASRKASKLAAPSVSTWLTLRISSERLIFNSIASFHQRRIETYRQSLGLLRAMLAKEGRGERADKNGAIQPPVRLDSVKAGMGAGFIAEGLRTSSGIGQGNQTDGR